jgi:hypothetical protein
VTGQTDDDKPPKPDDRRRLRRAAQPPLDADPLHADPLHAGLPRAGRLPTDTVPPPIRPRHALAPKAPDRRPDTASAASTTATVAATTATATAGTHAGPASEPAAPAHRRPPSRPVTLEWRPSSDGSAVDRSGAAAEKTDNPAEPRRRRRLTTAFAIVGVVAVLASSAVLVVAWKGHTPTTSPEAPRTMSVPATEDTFVSTDQPGQNHASEPELVVSGVPGQRTTAYLKFDLPALPKPGHVTAARIELSSAGEQPGGIRLYSVTDTAWKADGLATGSRPAFGQPLASAPDDPRARQVFDVTSTVQDIGAYAFALESPATDRAAVWYASEHGTDGPRIDVEWTPGAAGAGTGRAAGADGYQALITAVEPSTGTPSPAAESSPAGSSPETQRRDEASRRPTGPLQQSAVPRGKTLAGAAMHLRDGETYGQAVARADREYGPLELIRVYYPGLPPVWSGSRAEIAARTTVVSFKAPPGEILAGQHDASLTAWFAAAPKNRDTYWIYFHEPEDDIASGAFTAADYRAAWRRIAGLAAKAGNARLHPTLVLMCYSLNPASNRNWRDYYPGDDVISVLGWDCYNFGRRKGEYAPAESIFGKSIEVSRSAGKPFGYAEMGSALLPSDKGADRAAWLRQVGAYLMSRGPVWMAYWDDKSEVDFRLLDAPSQQAWRDVCRA